MSTIRDFESAPVGATATHDNGSRAMKADNVERNWITPNGFYLDNEEMGLCDYTLDPLDQPAPTTAREALDLAWELAHEVKPGQVIPEGARYLEVQGSGLREYTTASDFKIRPGCVPIRTLEPLPDPEPDWLDAPAVLATCGYCETKALHGPFEGRSRWECAKCQITTTWRALTDVTPLYPKETNK